MMETDRLPYRSPRDKEGHSRSVHDVTNLLDLVDSDGGVDGDDHHGGVSTINIDIDISNWDTILHCINPNVKS